MYAAETMTLTHQTAHRLRIAQRKIEQIMLGINLKNAGVTYGSQNKQEYQPILSNQMHC